jgi:hypothetical protein
MRCHICDSLLQEIHYNSDHEDYEPCPTCLAIIAEAVGKEKPTAEEDDLPPEDLSDVLPIIEGWYNDQD